MGVVYRAQDQKLGRYVALKFLPLELAGDPVALGRFQREARAASALNHPNICTIHGVEEHSGQPFIVMELLEGETLEARLAKGPLPVDTALALAIQIAGALDAAHRKSVVHRDLKPGNVLLTKSGPKVLDFGLAKMDRVAGSGLASAHVTREGAILGTLHYMSPEQVQGKAAGAASDIFSFGLVMYEMLAGQRAFGGQNSALVIAAILTAEPPVLTDAIFPAGLARVVRRCLAKDPEERWQSARDLKAALEWIADGEPAVLPPQPAAPPPVPAAARPAWPSWITSGMHPGPRNWLALGAFIAALAALILVAVPRWRDWRETAPSRPVTRFTVSAPGGGNITRLRLSPDGRSLAFVAGGRIYIRSFDSIESHVLEGTEGAGSPFWSPDGRSLAFPAAGKLKVIDIAGGVARVLCEVNTVVAGAWAPDGTILIGVVGDGLFRVAASGGPLTRFTQLDRSHNENRHLLPQFLPGGRRFLFTAGAVRAGESVLHAGSLDSAKRSAIMPVESNVTFAPSGADGLRGYLVFTRGNVLMARPFDAGQLRVEGEPFPIVESVGSTPALGAAVTIADFSAAGGALAYRPAISRQALDAGGITVIQNWMAGVRR
jgi:eukaryotic-like serine/threonine-protein kinase